MAGEASTTHLTKAKDAKGFPENKVAAQEGGAVAGGARRDLENKSGILVSSKRNYLTTPHKTTLLEE